MEIVSPRRILALGAPDSGILSVLEELTGTAVSTTPPAPIDDISAPQETVDPTPAEEQNGVPGNPAAGSQSSDNDPATSTLSTAGLTHALPLATRYYTTTLPIWIDEIPSLPLWTADFHSPAAAEVIRALGACIYVFRKPVTADDVRLIEGTLEAVAGAVEVAFGGEAGGAMGGSGGWDGVLVAVATGQSATPRMEERGRDEWEGMCAEWGFEFVDAEEKGKNEFGEQTGIARLKTALEANDWTAVDGDKVAGSGDEDGAGGEGSRDSLVRELEAMSVTGEGDTGATLQDLKMLLSRDGDDSARRLLGDADSEQMQVQELENIMMELRAKRDEGKTMEEEERKKFAARAVADLMKDLR